VQKLHIAGLLTSLAVVGALESQPHSQTRVPRRTVVVGGHEAVAGEVLVKFSRDPSPSDRLDLERLLDVDENQPIGGTRRMRSRSLDVATLRSLLRARRGVVYAEPNYILRAIGTPNDPQFPSLWGLNNIGQVINGRAGAAAADIHAVPAWTITTGSRTNVVTVIDTGVDYTHQDLAANMWSAPASFTVTIAGAPITCAAGTHGFNAIARTCDPKDDNNHGSHVAGTIGGQGNNTLGVTGINWDASIMAAKFLDATGSGSTSDAINAIEFAIQARNAFAASAGANVKVLSNSWGGGGFSQGLLDEINKANASGMLFVAAAGNSASNNDVTPSYPASFNAPNVVAVAATNNVDQLASFSNFGTSVHLAAPGVDILSTTIGNGYQFFSGTSMATPHVAGAALLVLSKCGLSVTDLKTAIVNNVDVIPSLNGRVSTSGRLNVDKALRSCTPAPSVPTGLILK
jgi:subtilisin family serine protease